MVDDEFGRIMAEVPARRRIVVVDSCHSGTISKERDTNFVSKYLPLLPDTELKELQISSAEEAKRHRYRDLTKEKETLLSACADAETSFEDRSKRSGLFTYWLLESMNRGASDLAGAFDEARRKVVETTRMAPSRQTPQLTDEYSLARDIKF
jgi:hypothetical protein